MENLSYLVENDSFCRKCIIQREKLFEYLDMKSSTILATLGPDGTSSSVAAKLFKSYLTDKKQAVDLKLEYYDTFELALEEIFKQRADFILLPNAYHNITNYYWDSKLELVYNFISNTPMYGIAAINIDDLINKERLIISVCKPVEHLMEEFWNTIEFKHKKYEIIEVSSNKRSFLMLQEGKVDLALTNASSIENSNAYFISKTKMAEFLWSIFMLKQNVPSISIDREAAAGCCSHC